MASSLPPVCSWRGKKEENLHQFKGNASGKASDGGDKVRAAGTPAHTTTCGDGSMGMGTPWALGTRDGRWGHCGDEDTGMGTLLGVEQGDGRRGHCRDGDITGMGISQEWGHRDRWSHGDGGTGKKTRGQEMGTLDIAEMWAMVMRDRRWGHCRDADILGIGTSRGWEIGTP